VSRLGELTQKVDAFFARVAERHGTDMQCATGCSDCCHARLTITGVEAAAIRALVAGWPAERRRGLAATGPGDPRSKLARAGAPAGGAGRAGDSPRGIAKNTGRAEDLAGERDRCAALDPAGRCKIYEARPLVCRSHGVPIRMRQGGLPVVQACHRNFTRTSPDPDCVLDQATLSATLLLVDADDERATGATTSAKGPPGGAPRAPGRRIDLAGLLADLAAI
jgi:Fe-S-cluster containining protein